MTESKFLFPVTKNAPAKVKDEGVINLVKSGKAAYNAKSGELLLLPDGERNFRELASLICDTLFTSAGAQPVDCGNDDAVYSLAERYTREWGDLANFYTDKRGRDIRLLGWSDAMEKSSDRFLAVKESVTSLLSGKSPEAKFVFVEDVPDPNKRSFMLMSPSSAGALSTENIFACPSCGKAFLPDSPYGYTPPQPGEGHDMQSLEDIETPGANTIAGLCDQLGIEIEYTLKAMLYIAYDDQSKPHPVASFVRGDYNVSMPKLAKWLFESGGLSGLRSAEKSELQEMIGEVAGFCGPVGLPENVVVVCDESVRGSKNVVVGANRAGYHSKGCCHGRDFDAPMADIAQVSAGVTCTCGSSSLEETAYRKCGNITLEKNEKPLSYRDREGSHEYPFELKGNLSVEMIMLAIAAAKPV